MCLDFFVFLIVCLNCRFLVCGSQEVGFFFFFWSGNVGDFFGGNDAEAETPVLWPPHAKS